MIAGMQQSGPQTEACANLIMQLSVTTLWQSLENKKLMYPPSSFTVSAAWYYTLPLQTVWQQQLSAQPAGHCRLRLQPHLAATVSRVRSLVQYTELGLPALLLAASLSADTRHCVTARTLARTERSPDHHCL